MTIDPSSAHPAHAKSTAVYWLARERRRERELRSSRRRYMIYCVALSLLLAANQLPPRGMLGWFIISTSLVLAAAFSLDIVGKRRDG
jgi:hypothetical protein